jgi:hypothetical protein
MDRLFPLLSRASRDGERDIVSVVLLASFTAIPQDGLD